MELRDNSSRARNARIGYIVLAIVSLIYCASSFMQAGLLDRMGEGDINLEEAEANDLRHVALTLLYYIAYIVALVLFILWFRRAYYNLAQVSPESASFDDGWAAGAWFVPFLNLVRPFQIMKEIWVGTHNRAGMDEKAHSLSLIGFWWALFLGGNIIGSIMSFGHDEETIEGLSALSRAVGWGTLISLPAIVLILVIIQQVHTAELKMRDEVHEPDIMRHLVSPDTNL